MSVSRVTGAHQKRKRNSTEQVVPGSEIAVGNGSTRRRTGRGSSLPTGPMTLLEDPNYPIPDFNNVYEKMRDPTTGLQLADRRWRLVSYSKCFIGKDAVQWIQENLSVDKASAISLGQRLMDAGIIQHVTQSEPFADDHYFFRFQEDDDSYVLNMKRVWDPKIPTRSAVTVSQALLTQLACLCEEYRARFVAAKNAATETPKAPARQGKTERSEPTSDDVVQAPGDSGPSLTLPQASQQNQGGLSTGILNSPLLGGILSSLTPHYAAASGSPNIDEAQNKNRIPPPGDTASESGGDDIDYSLLAKSEAFRQYTLAAAELQHVHLVGITPDESLAVFVNLYNTLCLHGYVVHGPPSNFYRRLIFFRSLSYRIAGLDMTLDDIEHGILRGNKRPPVFMFMQQLRPSDPKCQYVLSSRDARIHFVISAGTRSDPPIRILNGENVQEELHEATVEFLGCSVKVDKKSNVVTLPRIFLWYPDDFPTPEHALLKWVAKYLPVQRSDQLRELLADVNNPPSVVYESFDWNSAEARFEATAIRRKRRKLARECAPPGPSNQSSLLGNLLFPGLPALPGFPASSHDNIQRMLSTPLLASHPLLRRSVSNEETDAQSVTVNRPLSEANRLADIQFPMPPMPSFLPREGDTSGNPAEETSPTVREE